MNNQNFDKKTTDLLNLVIVSNQNELDILCSWCDSNNILPPYLGDRDSYPIACSVEQSTWTHRMNQDANYIAFDEFLESIK